MKEALLIFTKNLIYGEVKTRLGASIGKDRAFEIYRQLVQHTARETNGLPVDKIIFYSTYVEMDDAWNGCADKQQQRGSDLGEKMCAAFQFAFEKGYGKAVIIGTDCPGVDGAIIREAFLQLNQKDVVVGPATDGGYYLLGLKRNEPLLFQQMPWSTAAVFEETLSRVTQLRLSYSILPPLSDIDEEKDLIHLNLSAK